GHLVSSMPTASSVEKLSGRISALLVSKFTFCRRIMPVSSSSVSRSVTSIGQPFASTFRPLGVSLHWSMPSGTPSPSASFGQPFSSTTAPLGVFGHWSRPSNTPSPSVSSGQPVASTLAPCGVFGHLSFLSGTPSTSVSRGVPPNAKIRPAPRIMLCSFSSGPLNDLNDTSRPSRRMPSLSVIQNLSPPPNSIVPFDSLEPADGFAWVQPPPTNANGPPQRPFAGVIMKLALACDQSKSCPPGSSSDVGVKPKAPSRPYHDLDCQPKRAPTCRLSVSGRLLPGKRSLPSKIVNPAYGVSSQCEPMGSAAASPAKHIVARASEANRRR